MSDSPNSTFSNQKLIKIKPVQLSQRVSAHSVDEAEKDAKQLHQKIECLQQELDGLIEQKQLIVEETNQMIEQEKQDWQIEKNDWIKRAKQEGYDVGREEGLEAGQSAYEEKLKQANFIIDATTNDYHATIEKSDETILQLAVRVASKILNQTIADEPNVFMEVVRGAIKEIKEQSVVTIYLHPENYDFVVQNKTELIRILENDTKLSIYVDESLSENACVIEHPFGQIDAGVDTQLLKIREALLDYMMEQKQ